ncbi:hypothetical protein DM860_006814 [Cuscuta australis]|uniref:Uncharacterized protein n=1 Tax=Cuscuta australis TaxID=267555 RepID=A0A328E575_9ASTE|nr:hypothetical protein DM860_006814 [Cuscuta australis]
MEKAMRSVGKGSEGVGSEEEKGRLAAKRKRKNKVKKERQKRRKKEKRLAPQEQRGVAEYVAPISPEPRCPTKTTRLYVDAKRRDYRKCCADFQAQYNLPSEPFFSLHIPFALDDW